VQPGHAKLEATVVRCMSAEQMCQPACIWFARPYRGLDGVPGDLHGVLPKISWLAVLLICRWSDVSKAPIRRMGACAPSPPLKTEGTELRRLTAFGGGPNWCPDGARILFGYYDWGLTGSRSTR